MWSTSARRITPPSTSAPCAGTTPSSAIEWPLRRCGAPALGQGRGRPAVAAGASIPVSAEERRCADHRRHGAARPGAGRRGPTGLVRAGLRLGGARRDAGRSGGRRAGAGPTGRGDQRGRLHRGRRRRSRAGPRARGQCRRCGATWPRPARRVGARMIQVSTDFVFDGAASRPTARTIGRDRWASYGRTKLAGEREVVRLLGERGGDSPDRVALLAARGRNFVRTMLRLMSERDEVARGAGPDRHADLEPVTRGGDLGGGVAGPRCAASTTGPTRASRAGTTSPWRSRRRRWRWDCLRAAGADPAASHRRVSHGGATACPTACSTRP